MDSTPQMLHAHHPGDPPGGGRQTHESMHGAAMRPVAGPAGTDDLAAGGGLEVPGRDPQASSLIADAERADHASSPIPEPIPGAREIDTLVPREPGAIGAPFNGEDVPSPVRSEWLDPLTASEHALAGGGIRPIRHV